MSSSTAIEIFLYIHIKKGREELDPLQMVGAVVVAASFGLNSKSRNKYHIH